MSHNSPQLRWPSQIMDPLHVVALVFMVLAILLCICISAAGWIQPASDIESSIHNQTSNQPKTK